VVVAILHNPEKHGGVFSVDERIALIQVALQSAQVKNVEIHAFPGLAVDAARVVQADFMVKGLRNSGDFEIEQQMAHTNFAVAGIPTVAIHLRWCRPMLHTL
jgi:pantetheine-phosphate adenylyltransferase